MELDALFLVNRCCATADFSEADMPVVLLRPGLSRQIGLPSMDLITLKTNSIHMQSLQSWVSQKLDIFLGCKPHSVIEVSYEIYT
jgi:hypothetical protein